MYIYYSYLLYHILSEQYSTKNNNANFDKMFTYCSSTLLSYKISWTWGEVFGDNFDERSVKILFQHVQIFLQPATINICYHDIYIKNLDLLCDLSHILGILWNPILAAHNEIKLKKKTSFTFFCKRIYTFSRRSLYFLQKAYTFFRKVRISFRKPLYL